MDNHNVAAMLKRRGFTLLSANPEESLILPPNMEESLENELYELLKKYSFRIVIRDVIKQRESFGIADLLNYSTRECVEGYIAFLIGCGIVDTIGEGRFKLSATSLTSFGDTLEWFIAKVFEREFASPALWGVKLGGGKAGGDYDVVTSVEGRLVYVEVKSSPPKNVEEVEVVSFLKRVEEIIPSMAIFLEDTRLRMKDKIVPFFEGALRKKNLTVTRLHDETFSTDNRLFITNSAPDIVTNIGFCIQHHLKSEGFW
ncbi:MAG: hypothetical protein ACE5GF_08735 [Thermodesulfobacteriota bacterium]